MGQLIDIHPAQSYLSAADLIKFQQKFQQRGLAASAPADDRGRFSARDSQIQAAKERISAATSVTKSNVSKLDIGALLRANLRRRAFLILNLMNFSGPGVAEGRVMTLGQKYRDLIQRPGKLPDDVLDGHHGPERALSVDHLSDDEQGHNQVI